MNFKHNIPCKLASFLVLFDRRRRALGSLRYCLSPMFDPESPQLTRRMLSRYLYSP